MAVGIQLHIRTGAATHGGGLGFNSTYGQERGSELCGVRVGTIFGTPPPPRGSMMAKGSAAHLTAVKVFFPAPHQRLLICAPRVQKM